MSCWATDEMVSPKLGDTGKLAVVEVTKQLMDARILEALGVVAHDLLDTHGHMRLEASEVLQDT
jgi:hypothetical protein